MDQPAGPGREPGPSARSCHTCNRKKIRCSKTQPCEACLKLGVECVFPGPGRAPRRRKRPLKAELVSRLKHLEEEIQDLGDRSHATELPSRETGEPVASHVPENDEVANLDLPPVPERHTHSGRGRLIIGRRSSRYVTHEALVSLGDQVKELQDLLDTEHPGERAQEESEPEYLESGNFFLFGYSSGLHSLEDYHPSRINSELLWTAYEENVAPMAMLFHKPTLRKLICKASTNAGHLDKKSEALVFAVYLAAVTSMKPQQCQDHFGEDHSTIVQRFRFATQQALTRAGFLQTRDFTVLQAAVLFLIVLRSPGDLEFVWTMTAAVHRLAQGLGLHRDGTNFGLSPFDTEMRRRLWWYIVILDFQTSEYQAINSQIQEKSYDVRFPLNINDADIAPDTAETPTEYNDFTEMTFCLIRCEISVAHRRILSNKSGVGPEACPLQENLHLLGQLCRRLQEQHLKFCDVSVPLQWVAATVARLAHARSWLVAHLPWLNTEELAPGSPKRDQLFQTATEVVEFAYLLETNDKTTKWGWLFEAYMQWHAAVFVLSELCIRPRSVDTDKAWIVMDQAYALWKKKEFQKGGMMLRPISSLMERAAITQGRQQPAPEGLFSHPEDHGLSSDALAGSMLDPMSLEADSSLPTNFLA
ncbi:fungal-specific transcription factor domain-containing protein [Penicillium alfredii]|uniref:Fungal-specific transcription factor domain-containing protein n=1 Tax=Penicillium alfredii TaxID=1506179 RepID=A0A9W9F8R6_9EURO|nr:fungal-specific transcription factor domain-containing protein [Penicillium alfredii]KAJ5095667.1 fungal-specific transcription factor domain-containing protein [Penicillium alfredii]